MKLTAPPPSPERITTIIIVGVAMGAMLGGPIKDLISFVTGYETVQSD